MRGVRLPLRVGIAILAVLATAPLSAAPGRAEAAAGCPAGLTRPRGGPITALPWAQRWYEPARLSGIADGHGITVAVIDSGVDAEHPQLRGKVLRGRDFLVTSGVRDERTDCVSHGPEVASI